jgi:hypothetical protein
MVTEMLRVEPTYQRLLRSSPADADYYLKTLVDKAEAQAITPILYLLDRKGSLQPNGSRVLDTELYLISGQGSDGQVLRKESQTYIFKVENGIISNDLTPKDFKIFTEAAATIKQQEVQTSTRSNEKTKGLGFEH